MDRERLEHSKHIDQYKEQVTRMRENIDLFKDNMRVLREQNEELQQKIHNQNSQQDFTNPQIVELFEGLKEDNVRLADEVKRLQEENFSLQGHLGVSRDTVQQQAGIISSLQKVVETIEQQMGY